jgi:hypothetical protein
VLCISISPLLVRIQLYKLYLANEAPVPAELSTKTAILIRQENGKKLHSSTHQHTFKEKHTAASHVRSIILVPAVYSLMRDVRCGH